MNHVWQQHETVPHYLLLAGVNDAIVRTKPSPNGLYLWQFRKVASYAPSIAAAKEYVEAGAEFFATMRRNPYL